jgi:hypothetical protein
MKQEPKLTTLTVTEDQLRLVQRALDFYARVGIGQMWAIKEHPTYERHLADKLRSKEPLKVGDQTERGEVVEIGEGYIKTKGSWGKGEEIKTWKDPENVKRPTDYGRYHEIRDNGERILNQGRNMLLQEEIPDNGSWGIHNPNADESCRVAYDLVQIIRHEFWKNDPERSNMTVDSSVLLHTKDTHKVKCEI